MHKYVIKYQGEIEIIASNDRCAYAIFKDIFNKHRRTGAHGGGEIERNNVKVLGLKRKGENYERNIIPR